MSKKYPCKLTYADMGELMILEYRARKAFKTLSDSVKNMEGAMEDYRMFANRIDPKKNSVGRQAKEVKV